MNPYLIGAMLVTFMVLAGDAIWVELRLAVASERWVSPERKVQMALAQIREAKQPTRFTIPYGITANPPSNSAVIDRVDHFTHNRVRV